MTRTYVRWAGAGLVGLIAGLGLWFAVGFVLVILGFSFYSVHVASYVALTLWILTAPLAYFKAKKRNPQFANSYIAPLLIGIGLTIAYFALAWAIAHH